MIRECIDCSLCVAMPSAAIFLRRTARGVEALHRENAAHYESRGPYYETNAEGAASRYNGLNE